MDVAEILIRPPKTNIQTWQLKGHSLEDSVLQESLAYCKNDGKATEATKEIYT